jgi:alkanesulfonate monooxygenase SsuD/methylene tetrahydromethanopterin reductase-like flavin-dependent oxidoreductase (luciferase family)
MALAMTRQQFEAGATLHGHNVIGSPEQVIEKIVYQHGLFQHDRFLLQMSVGTLPHASIMRAIELYGTVVAPAVRDRVG